LKIVKSTQDPSKNVLQVRPILCWARIVNAPAFALLKAHIHLLQYRNRAASALAILPVVVPQ